MTPLDTLHLPAKPEGDCALTSDQIDERVRRIGLQPPGPRREAVREETIRLLMPVARRIAGKYRNYKGEDPDDLFQVACVGLVKAIDGYDPEHGHAFLSYAVPTISGELKRHLRDRSGVVRVPRAVQEVREQARRAQLELDRRPVACPCRRRRSPGPAGCPRTGWPRRCAPGTPSGPGRWTRRWREGAVSCPRSAMRWEGWMTGSRPPPSASRSSTR